MGTSNKDGMEKAFNSLKLTDYLEEFLNDLGKRMIQSTDDHRESAFLFQRLSMLIQRYNAVAVLGTFDHTTPNDEN